MKSKPTAAETIFLIAIALTVLFIWVHSMMSRAASSAESGWVMMLIEPALEIVVGQGNVTQHLVRKLAHFTEYFVLGTELAIYFELRGLRNASRHIRTKVIAPLAIGLAVASIDETIQIFSGRGPAVADVMLDFSGVLAATIIIRLIVALSRH